MMISKKSPSQGNQELICINVDKVYDWVTKEATFDYFLPNTPISFTGITSTTSLIGATVSCEVTPATTNPVLITRRENRMFTIDGHCVCLQQLTIQKSFNLVIIVTLANGSILRSTNIPFMRSEIVTLCAPEGTEVTVTYTDLDCFVSSPGTMTLDTTAGTITFTGLVLTVTTCQSIQSTFPVTVEFTADYCEPRADFIGSCGPPTRPPQCPTVFPEA